MQQSVTNGPISRAEYEARHSELIAKIAQNEARLVSELATIRIDTDRKFDRLIESLDGLRRDLVAERALEPRLLSLSAQIARNASDIAADNEENKQRINAIEKRQIANSERSILRIGAFAGFGGLIVYLLQLITHFKP